MSDWSTRIPAAIADGEKLLDGDEYVLIPPHIGGNETKLTLVLTAGEVALVKALYPIWDEPERIDIADDAATDALVAFTEKMEGLNHD